MAKGRRLTISRSERYLGSYTGHSYTNNVSESAELREEDVWSMVEGGSAGVDDDYYGNGEAESEWETLAVAKPPPIPSRDRQVGGLALAFEEFSTSSRIVHQLRPQDGFTVDAPPSRRQRQVASSAPVNVPDWKRILRVNSVESMNDSDEGELEYERDSAVDPPHEYLARSRSKDATSVFEGVGRTLKGRDMRRLRDTVWSQTGVN
ncbi:hypothetical protein V2J09_002763 [Rumex salicifolius]